MARVNRFPKMAALQKFRALKLGYDEKTAEAIGIAEALKYAIFKNLSKYRRGIEREREKPEKKEIYEKLDWETFKTFQLAAKDGLPFVGGKVETPEDYRKAVFGKFGEDVGKRIEEWAHRIIESTPREYLEDERKFFNYVWKPHRDDPIEY